MNEKRKRPLLRILLLIVVGLVTSPANALPNVDWARQLGSPGEDRSEGVAVDGLGNVFTAGLAGGSLGDSFLGGYFDAFVSKYDSHGNSLWTRQFGTDGWDQANGVAADAVGNSYVVGDTSGVMGASNVGGMDSFVSKFDPSGTLLWTNQFGSSVSVYASQYTTGITTDGFGNLYVSGNTPADRNYSHWDAFVTKLDVSGNLLWTRQFGSSLSDSADAVTTDRFGNVFVAGNTYGDLGDPHVGSTHFPDALLSKLDSVGNLVWSRQLGGTFWDFGFGAVTDDEGNIYVGGATDTDLGGPMMGGFHDAFIAKYGANGDLQWVRQIGGPGADEAYGIAIDATGVYISGNTDGWFNGQPHMSSHTFVAKYGFDGSLLSTDQIGVGSARSIAVDEQHGIFLAGDTYDSLDGPIVGVSDAFLAKVAGVPEPCSATLATMLAAIVGATRHRMFV